MKLLQVPKQLDNIKYLLLTSAKQIEKSMKTKEFNLIPQTIKSVAGAIRNTTLSTKELNEATGQMKEALSNTIPALSGYNHGDNVSGHHVRLAQDIRINHEQSGVALGTFDHSPSEEEVEEIIRQSNPPIFVGNMVHYSPMQNTDDDEEKFDILVLNVLSGIQGKVPIGADTYKKILLLEAEGKDSKEIIGIILSGLNDKPKPTKRKIRL